jgi:excisionase family DNA binding protein
VNYLVSPDRRSLALLLREMLSPTPSPVEPLTDPSLLTPREAAKVLKLSESTLWRLAKKGDIQYLKIGQLVRYSPRSLARWIEENLSTGPAAEGEPAVAL